MLPPFLVNTYKRYKQDTDDFSSWLDATARSCGYSGPTPISKPDKSDGKKRYAVPLSSFTSLAKTIADFDPKIVVPKHIGKIGRRAVALRWRFSDWYRGKANVPKGKRVNHEHFIRVFEETLRILKVEKEERLLSETSEIKQKANARDKIDAALNQFMTLEIEEPKDVPMTKKTSSKAESSKPSQQPPVAHYEVEDDLEDDEHGFEIPQEIFEIFCLLEDLNALREFIKQLWMDFRSGKVDLMTTAVVTNTAIDFARRSCNDFAERNEKMKNARSFLDRFLGIIGALRQEDPNYRENPDDPYNMNLHDLIKWGYADTFILLESMKNAYKPDVGIPVYKPGYYGTYNPRDSRSKMGPRKKFGEDKILLVEALPEFAFLAEFKVPLPADDEFSRGMIKMLVTKELPLWLCFAARIFLDIQHRLRTEVATPFNQLRNESNRVRKTLEMHFKFSANMKTPNWPAQNDENLKRIVTDIELYIVNDFFLAVKNDADIGEKSGHTFLKRHCLQAGVLLFNINLRMHEAGILLASAWGSVIYPAFLYNDIKQQNYAKLHWPDMEQVIRTHGEESIFGGKKPNDTESSYRRAVAMLGFNTEMGSGSGSRAPNMLHSKEGPKGLSGTTEIAELLKKRYVYGGSIEVSFESVEELLNELNRKSAAVRSKASSALKKKWDTQKSLAPLELLALLREKLMDEERKLLFNYFGLHQRCIDLLRLLRKEHHLKFVQYFTENYIEKEYQLSYVINYIFMVGMGSQANANTLLPNARQKYVVRSLMLTKTGELMAKWLGPNGAIAMKELRGRVKNKALLDPEMAAKSKSSPAFDSGSLIALSDVLGLSPEEVKAASTGMRTLL